MISRLTLLIITSLLCTCVRAQRQLLPFPEELTNVAFIKSESGQLIDSLNVKTSLMEAPASFPFPGDTLWLDIEILSPVDEVTLEAFAAGHSFKSDQCFVGGPAADVHLSINSGRVVVDSINRSEYEQIFRQRVAGMSKLQNIDQLERELLQGVALTQDELSSVHFLKAYLNLPTVESSKAFNLKNILDAYFDYWTEHPNFIKPLAHLDVLTRGRAISLKKGLFLTPRKRPAPLTRPEAEFFVLNVYEHGAQQAEQEHRLIQDRLLADSVLQTVPILSIAYGESFALWGLYTRTNDFSWPHYWEPYRERKMLTPGLNAYGGNTYLLVDKKGMVRGVFDDAVRLVAKLYWMRESGELR